MSFLILIQKAKIAAHANYESFENLTYFVPVGLNAIEKAAVISSMAS